MSGDANEPGRDPDVGTVVEEAAKLLGALSDWAKDAAHLGADLGHGLDGHLATGAPECTYCPICRTVHAADCAKRESCSPVSAGFRSVPSRTWTWCATHWFKRS